MLLETERANVAGDKKKAELPGVTPPPTLSELGVTVVTLLWGIHGNLCGNNLEGAIKILRGWVNEKYGSNNKFKKRKEKNPGLHIA